MSYAKMGNTQRILETYRDADARWSAELKAAFGDKAIDARHHARGRGKPGTTLREAYEEREAARIEWDAAWSR